MAQGWCMRFNFFARVGLGLLILQMVVAKNVVHGHDPRYVCNHTVV